MAKTEGMEILGTLFSSDALVKIMRLYLMNPAAAFDLEDIVSRCKIKAPSARAEINILQKIKFLHKRSFSKTVIVPARKKGGEPTEKKKKTNGWVLNYGFPYVTPLRNLLIDSDLISVREFPKRFRATGKIKLLVLSGLFMKDEDRKVDVLVVGDHLNRKRLEQVFSVIESEIGKEVRYAVFDTDGFMYRVEMYDKLLRDVFDYPHEKVINKLSINL